MEDSASTETKPKWDEKTYALSWKVLSRFQNIPYEDREDIIQDFATDHPYMEGFDGLSKLSTWLHSCLSNKARDFLRREGQTRVEPEKRRKIIALDAPQKTEEGEKTKELAAKCEEHDPFLHWVDYAVACFYAGERLDEYIKATLGTGPYSFEKLLPIYADIEQDRLTAEYRKHKKMCVPCTIFDDQFLDMTLSNEGFLHFHEKWVNFREQYHPGMLRHDLFYNIAKESQMATVEEAIKAKQEYEAKKDAAIKELLEQRKNIDSQLVELGYVPEIRVKGQRACKVCGQAGHNAARHKSKAKQDGRKKAQ